MGRAPLRTLLQGQDGKNLETERRGVLYARRCLPNQASKRETVLHRAPSADASGGAHGEETAEFEPEPCKYVRAACAGKEGEAFQGPRAWSLGSLFLEGRPRFARAGRFAMSLHDADNKNVQC